MINFSVVSAGMICASVVRRWPRSSFGNGDSGGGDGVVVVVVWMCGCGCGCGC